MVDNDRKHYKDYAKLKCDCLLSTDIFCFKLLLGMSANLLQCTFGRHLTVFKLFLIFFLTAHFDCVHFRFLLSLLFRFLATFFIIVLVIAFFQSFSFQLSLMKTTLPWAHE